MTPFSNVQHFHPLRGPGPLNTDPGRSGLPVVAIVVRLVRFE